MKIKIMCITIILQFASVIYADLQSDLINATSALSAAANTLSSSFPTTATINLQTNSRHQAIVDKWADDYKAYINQISAPWTQAQVMTRNQAISDYTANQTIAKNIVYTTASAQATMKSLTVLDKLSQQALGL